MFISNGNRLSATIRLKPGKDKLPRHRHPWIFSGAIQSIKGNPVAGDLVAVTDSAGGFIAYGHYSPHSQIRARLLDWDAAAVINVDWWARMLATAVMRRDMLAQADDTTAYRLIYGEADFLPGLIVDRLGDFLVLQALTVGVDQLKFQIAEQLQTLLKPAGIYERSDADSRQLEGLPISCQILTGQNPPDEHIITENGLDFAINIKEGHKTGYYLDQRDNRRRIAAYVKGKTVLDCFCYTGSFSANCLRAGAAATTLVDSSAAVLTLARQNLQRNGFTLSDDAFIQANVFTALRDFQAAGNSWDVVILDPPKLAPRRANLTQAERAYKDLNLSALRLLKTNGILATFSCSGNMSAENFQRVVAWAAADAGREVQIIAHLSQGSDHPIRLSFPESEYLTGLICRVV